MKKKAWLITLFLLAALYFISSIPGLRVLPVLNQINSILVSLDLTFVRLSQWLASLLPLDFSELGHIDTLTEDVLTYARENPVIIEFFLRKVAHVVVYFIITLALFFLFHQYFRNSTVSVILSFLAAGTIGYFDEYRQTFVEGRYGSMVDVFINFIGISLATCLILFSFFITRRGREKFFHNKEEESKEESIEEGKEEDKEEDRAGEKSREEQGEDPREDAQKHQGQERQLEQGKERSVVRQVELQEDPREIAQEETQEEIVIRFTYRNDNNQKE